MVRCRKCHAKGSSISLHEVWSGDVMEFEQNDDGSINPNGFLIQNSDPVSVRALCLRCSHKWTLRGVPQIVCLSGHPDYVNYIRWTREVKP